MIVTCRQCSSGSIDDLLIDAVTQPYCSILPILSINTSLSCVFSEHGGSPTISTLQHCDRTRHHRCKTTTGG